MKKSKFAVGDEVVELTMNQKPIGVVIAANIEIVIVDFSPEDPERNNTITYGKNHWDFKHIRKFTKLERALK